MTFEKISLIDSDKMGTSLSVADILLMEEHKWISCNFTCDDSHIVSGWVQFSEYNLSYFHHHHASTIICHMVHSCRYIQMVSHLTSNSNLWLWMDCYKTCHTYYTRFIYGKVKDWITHNLWNSHLTKPMYVYIRGITMCHSNI